MDFTLLLKAAKAIIDEAGRQGRTKRRMHFLVYKTVETELLLEPKDLVTAAAIHIKTVGLFNVIDGYSLRYTVPIAGSQDCYRMVKVVHSLINKYPEFSDIAFEVRNFDTNEVIDRPELLRQPLTPETMIAEIQNLVLPLLQQTSPRPKGSMTHDEVVLCSRLNPPLTQEELY